MSLYDQAVANTATSKTSASSVFVDIFVNTGLADSTFWFVVGFAVSKFFF